MIAVSKLLQDILIIVWNILRKQDNAREKTSLIRVKKTDIYKEYFYDPD